MSGIRTVVALPLIALLSIRAGIAETSRYEEPIRYRQAVMTLVKRHYEQVLAMAKGKQAFDREALNRHAALLDLLSKVSLDGFVAGSHEGATKAKPEIWKDWPRFRAQAEKFQAQTARLKEVAKAGSPEEVKSVMSDLTTVCKNCHDDFKNAAVSG